MSEISRFVTGYLINSVLEIPALFGIAFFCSRLIRRTPWSYQHTFWVSTLVVCTTVPLAVPRHSVFSSLATATASASAIDGRSESAVANALRHAGSWLHLQHSGGPVHFNTSLIWILTGSYCLFVLWRLLALTRAWCAAKRLRQSGCVPPPHLTNVKVAEACMQDWGIKNVRLISSTECVAPMTDGHWQPAVFFPQASFTGMSSEDFRSAINHEMAHIRRSDYLLNLVLQVLYVPVSFHPVAMLVKSQLERTRELACDDLAAEKSPSRITYARSLLKIAQSICPDSANTATCSLGLFEARIFEKRITNLLESACLRSGNWSRALTLLCLTLLFGGAITVPLVSVQVASSASLPTNLTDFGGSWRGQFRGRTFVLLNLHVIGDKLTGTCTHTISIERNSAGELTHVDEKNTEDQIVEVRLDGNRLFLKIADNGDAQNAMECAFWLTSKDQAALQVLSSNGGTWKPWKLARTPYTSAQ
jgi:beta-lactamase regulating signal transducer with metallopeptidase domain